jgi:hypothetical protein
MCGHHIFMMPALAVGGRWQTVADADNAPRGNRVDDQTRPAQAGELCTCGRQAVTVIPTEQYGDVGHCGIEGAAFRPVLPCPWCGTAEAHTQAWGDPARCPDYTLHSGL